MTVNLTDINWQGYTRAIDIDQVWAQATDLYLNGEQWDLTDAERETASDINSQYEMVDMVMETLLRFYAIEPWNKVDWISTYDIMSELKDPNRGNLKAGIEISTQKLASALTKLGLDKPGVRTVGHKGQRGYFGIRLLP
jgi:predicted P-loop ATPase